jgi:hypothetical protein
MAKQLFTNNAATTLASSITNSATSLTVATGDGAKFPALSGGDWFLATLFQVSGVVESNHEIVKVTARSTDAFTIVRAQDGTTGRAFSTGDHVELRWTAAVAQQAADSLPLDGSKALTASLDFSGGSARVTADFSNATLASRLMFQSRTTNGGTSIAAMPNGTAGFSQWQAWDGSDIANAGRATFSAIAGEVRISQDKFGTASYGSITFYTGGSERVRIDASGNLILGVQTAQRVQGDYSNATHNSRTLFQSVTTDGNTAVGAVPNGSATVAQFISYNSADPTNSAFLGCAMVGNEARISSGIVGTGTYSPLTFYTNGAEKMRLDTGGNLGIGKTAGDTHVLDVNGRVRGASFHESVRTVSAGTSLTAADGVIIANTGGGGFTLTLPSAAAAGTGYSCTMRIVKSFDANNLVIAVPSGQSLNGTLNGTYTNSVSGSHMEMFSDGSTGWWTKSN